MRTGTPLSFRVYFGRAKRTFWQAARSTRIGRLSLFRPGSRCVRCNDKPSTLFARISSFHIEKGRRKFCDGLLFFERLELCSAGRPGANQTGKTVLENAALVGVLRSLAVPSDPNAVVLVKDKQHRRIPYHQRGQRDPVLNLREPPLYARKTGQRADKNGAPCRISGMAKKM